MTENLPARLKLHNVGKVKSTKAFIPWKMIHHEVFNSSLEARARAKYFKSAAGRRGIKKRLLFQLKASRLFVEVNLN